ncbi:hypothetical protein HanXRQr2_Chr12g0522521 [Helianthus annuus]|uniref:Uncharacterized protein n=1 Tax=Helianthus annuus TaxID=4232 RepID=A0A9K3EM35_HELAN|nr:hypothetical protein HanXRQr2_Chr12g0522521 [Helianthus annuus]KAJ0861163.1 hypothetical protein HanPSC8_Chr12g0503641 [Helianthus annuus]
MPEFPHPTTKTFWFSKQSPLLYELVCKIGPVNSFIPSNFGTTSSAFSPVATITHRLTYSAIFVFTLHNPHPLSYSALTTVVL